jgi:hypothetical protein
MPGLLVYTEVEKREDDCPACARPMVVRQPTEMPEEGGQSISTTSICPCKRGYVIVAHYRGKRDIFKITSPTTEG